MPQDGGALSATGCARKRIATTRPSWPLLPKRRPKPGDTWHLDEVFLKINGELHYLWRTVDQHGVVLDILVQGRWNATTAKHFFKRLLAGLKYKPKRIVTDGLRGYRVAHRKVLPEVKHWTSRSTAVTRTCCIRRLRCDRSIYRRCWPKPA